MYTGKNARGMVGRFSFRAGWNYWGWLGCSKSAAGKKVMSFRGVC